MDKALTALGVCEIGKPIVIEETLPLSCTIAEMDDFIKRSKNRTQGYISFYWGKTVADYSADTKNKELSALMIEWLGYFQKQSDFMKREK